MYCPSCGAEAPIGLNYCNRCGANLGILTTPSQTVQINLTKPALLIGVMLTVLTLGGFGLLIGGARALAAVVNGSDPLMAMILFGMIIILTIDVFLVRQLAKLINAALSTDNPPKTLRHAQPANLPMPRASAPPLGAIPSVTENTTRFLDVNHSTSPELQHPQEKLKG
jgi:hypothetical protein